MQRSEDGPPTAANTATDKATPTGSYEVGYGKPPAAHRFKPGNNANPKGRRKGARNRKIVIREILFEPVTVREGSETRQMPALEAVLKKMLSKALAGDNKAALTIIGIAQKEGILTPEQERMVEDLPESDLEILEDAKRRLGAGALEQSPSPAGQPDPDLPRAGSPSP